MSAFSLPFLLGTLTGCAITLGSYFWWTPKTKLLKPCDSLTRDFLQILRIGRNDILMMAYARQILGRMPKLLRKSKERRITCIRDDPKRNLSAYVRTFNKYQSLIEEELSLNTEKLAFCFDQDP
jgi:hypothetical protein